MSDAPPSPIPLLDLSRQIAALDHEIQAAIRRVISSGRFILGPEVTAFEAEVATHLGAAHAVGVGNGTDALWLALRALEIGPGDAVLTSPFTFFATASAIAGTGARIALADIDPETFNLSPAAVRAVLDGECEVSRRVEVDPARVRAILPVHLYGQPADLHAFEALARDRGLAIVEDAAQALGARVGERAIGASAGLACFSFFPSKNLGAFGDGGLVTTEDPTLADRVRQLRAHGSRARYEHHLLGTNSRLDAIQAAILRVKLPHLDAWVKARRRHAAAYSAALDGIPGLTPPVEAPGRHHAYHQYTVRLAQGRDDAARRLAAAEIGHAVYYARPLHQQPALADLGYRPGDFPVAEQAAREVLSLPIFPELRPEERDRVVDTLRSHLLGT